jgi:hypothetical protein
MEPSADGSAPAPLAADAGASERSVGWASVGDPAEVEHPATIKPNTPPNAVLDMPMNPAPEKRNGDGDVRRS